MEQKGLRVLEANATFFTKITTTITKILIPTKVGINSLLIALKRNAVIKAYEIYNNINSIDDPVKKDIISHKYEDAYALYLEAIDKYIMDSVYTKVKSNNASDFEKIALSKYYEVTNLKENEYLEYKYRKQKYLLELDYESIKENTKTLNKFASFYINKIDSLYKAILKNYSVQLSDSIHSNEQYKDQVYIKIFKTLEDYVSNILPIKLTMITDEKTYQTLLKEYEKYEKFTVGKLDEKECVEKNMVLLGISRQLFTHSLPLIATEQCYICLIKSIRMLIVNAKTKEKQEEAYQMLIKLIEEYNVKLLSTKIYWDRLGEKENYKKFWNAYKSLDSEEEKEILFIKSDLEKLRQSKKDYDDIVKFYKCKLVEFGAMKSLKNTYKLINKRYTSVKGKLNTYGI